LAKEPFQSQYFKFLFWNQSFCKVSVVLIVEKFQILLSFSSFGKEAFSLESSIQIFFLKVEEFDFECLHILAHLNEKLREAFLKRSDLIKSIDIYSSLNLKFEFLLCPSKKD